MNPQSSSDARRVRGLQITERNVISENEEDGSFCVPSESQEGVAYEVRLIGETWVCNCPDFENRADEIELCKHAHAVKFWIASNAYLQEKPKPKVFAEDTIQCDKCGSIKVIHYGTYKGKQIYKCMDCQHKFREGLIKNARYSPETITLTLDLYFSGMSYNKIARSLNDNFDMNLGSASIYRLVKRYVPQISEYVNSLCPQLSETWHADEVFQKMKGGVTYKRKSGIAFLWNVMDRKTRYLVASKLSERRDAQGAIRAFREAIKNAHGSEPEKVFNDGLKAYREGIAQSFTTKPEQIERAGITKPHANNNRIERMNGTQRERFRGDGRA